MNLVQQRRDFLDFIEHDPRLRWAITHDGFESVWVAGQFQKQGGVKEVEAGRVSERLPQPGADRVDVGRRIVAFIREPGQV